MWYCEIYIYPSSSSASSYTNKNSFWLGRHRNTHTTHSPCLHCSVFDDSVTFKSPMPNPLDNSAYVSCLRVMKLWWIFLQTVEGSVHYYLYRLEIVLLEPTRILYLVDQSLKILRERNNLKWLQYSDCALATTEGLGHLVSCQLVTVRYSIWALEYFMFLVLSI